MRAASTFSVPDSTLLLIVSLIYFEVWNINVLLSSWSRILSHGLTQLEIYPPMNNELYACAYNTTDCSTRVKDKHVTLISPVSRYSKTTWFSVGIEYGVNVVALSSLCWIPRKLARSIPGQTLTECRMKITTFQLQRYHCYGRWIIRFIFLVLLVFRFPRFVVPFFSCFFVVE